MDTYYRIVACIELPDEQRKAAGEANPHRGELFRYEATARKLHASMAQPQLYRVATCYRSAFAL
jgi:hypothetical protein